MKSKGTRRVKTPTAFVTIVLLLSLFSFNISAVAADYWDYNHYEGSDQGNDVDPVLESLIGGLNSAKFDSSGNPEGEANGTVVSLSDSFTFTWSSEKKVKFVYVKAGTGGILFDYGGATEGSIDLIQIYDYHDVAYDELTYINFYYCQCPTPTPEEPTPTPTPEEPTPTPTPEEPTPTPTPEEPTPTPTPEEPTPTPTPEEPTPTPTPEEPTPTPTPEEPTPTPTPEEPTPTPEITPEPIPGSGTVIPEEETLNFAEEQIPAAPAALPKTGGIPAGVLYGIGGVISLGGLLMKRKSSNKKS